MSANVFYFVAQYGSVHATHPTAPTNFYVYTIPEIRRGEVFAEIEHATLGPSGLEYPAKFLHDLDAWDRQGKRISL